MKIALDFVADETPLFVTIGEQLAKEGHNIIGLTLGKRWRELWEGRFPTSPILTVPINHKSDIRPPFNVAQEMERIEQEYGEFHPSAFLPSDRFLYKYDRNRQIIALIDTFKSLEKFFDREKPDIYFCTPIAYLFNLVSHAVCTRRGITHISIYITRGFTPGFTYSTGVRCRWDPVIDIYQKLMSGVSVVDKNTMDAARETLEQFRSAPQRPYYMTRARVNYDFRFVFVKEFFTRLKYYYIDGWCGNSSDYMTKSPFWYALRDAKKYIRAGLFSKFRDFVFDSSKQKGLPYYLYPLNMQPEASTLMHAEWNIDLLSSIKNISRSLPLGTYLYVKEHTSAFGRRGLGFYNAVKKLHNVRLLGPWENTYSLIINSLGVILLSSTMGWEALMQSKPIYVLGRLFCSELSADIEIKSYDELRQRLYEDFHNKEKQPMVSDESLVAFIAAMQVASFPGIFGPAKLDIRQPILAKKNVQEVTDGIKQIVEHFCGDKH